MMMGGAGVCCDLVMMDLELMSRASVLLPFSFRKFLLIQLQFGDVDLCHRRSSENGPHGDGRECPGGVGKWCKW